MSIANFGSFLGGMAQGQQNAENQRERAAYLAMLQKRQKDADDDASSTRDAVFANNYMEGSQTPDPTAVFAGGMPPGQPPAPQPGQASVPMQQPGPQGGPPPGGMPPQGPPPQMAQPGATPMPGPQGPPPGGPPQGPQGGPPPTPYAPPQAKPTIVPQGQPRPAPGSQPQGQPTDGFAQAEKALNDTKAALAMPEAEQVAKDPKVQTATKQYHDYVKELNDAGIAPGKGKPDLVQMKRLQLLHDNLALASADASKHVSADRKVQYEFGTKYADLYAKKQASENVLKAREDAVAGANTRAAGRAGGAGGVSTFNELSEDALKNLAEDYQKIGPSVLPWSRSRGQGGDITKFQNWMANNGYGASAGERAGYKADTSSAQKLTPLADRLEAAQGTFHQNFDRAIKAAQKAGLKDNMPLNQVANWLREKGGDPDTAAFLANIATAQGEYAKLLSASTSAGGSSVEALRRASDMISPNMTLAQLKSVQQNLEADGKAVTGELRKAAKGAVDRTRATSSNRGGSAPAGGSSAGPAVTRAAIKAYATQSGMTEQEVETQLKARGATIGE